MTGSMRDWWLAPLVRLSRAEEARLAARARQGDAAAIETLVAAHAPWIARLVQMHFGPRGRRVYDRVAPHEPLDDLLQQGVLAMLERLPTFDPRRGRMTTWLALVVVQGVGRWRHRHRSVIVRPAYVGGRNAAAQQRAVRIDSLDASTWRPTAAEPDVAKDPDRRAQLAALDAAIDNLEPRLRTVIRGRLKGLRLRDLADELGLSKERIRQLALAAEAQLRATLAGGRYDAAASATCSSTCV